VQSKSIAKAVVAPAKTKEADAKQRSKTFPALYVGTSGSVRRERAIEGFVIHSTKGVARRVPLL